MLLKQLPPLPALTSLPVITALPKPPLPADLARRLPLLLARKASWIPFGLQRSLLLKVMTQAFQEPLDEGDFEFLQGRWMQVEITDIGLSWCFSYSPEGALLVSDDAPADACIRGKLKEFMLLAGRREDPDTLFFQRRLMIEGDTELGLEVKNLLDAVDHDSLPPLLKLILNRGSGLASRLL